MTYFGFLAVFIFFPILILAAFLVWEKGKDGSITGRRSDSKYAAAIGIHMILAVLYTTPWDNYLVATRVWYYESTRISGIVLGFVPLEEYAFFLLQTLLVGLWWRILSRRMPAPEGFKPSKRLRTRFAVLAALIWLGSAFVFLDHRQSLTYLSIILFWALPAIIPQMAFGADILWHRRKLLAWTVLPMVFYLSLTDSLAIAAGVWTINPAKSTGIFIGGLPLEEGVFFFVTILLISFGVTLLTAEESQPGWTEIKRAFRRFSAEASGS